MFPTGLAAARKILRPHGIYGGRNRTAGRRAPCGGPELPIRSPPGRPCQSRGRRAARGGRSGLGPLAPPQTRTGSTAQGRRRTRHLAEPQAEQPGSTTGKAGATARPRESPNREPWLETAERGRSPESLSPPSPPRVRRGR